MFQLLAPHATPAAAKKAKASAKKGDACAFKLTCVTSVGAAIDSIGEGYVNETRTVVICRMLCDASPLLLALHRVCCPVSSARTVDLSI